MKALRRNATIKKHVDGNESMITLNAVISLQFIFRLNMWAVTQS